MHMQVYSSHVHGTSAESVLVQCLLHTHAIHATVTFGHVSHFKQQREETGRGWGVRENNIVCVIKSSTWQQCFRKGVQGCVCECECMCVCECPSGISPHMLTESL